MNDGAVPDRRRWRDHQLVGRARGAVHRVRRRVGVRQLGGARRGQRVIKRPPDRVGLRRLVRGWGRVVLPVRVARVGRLDEPEPGRAAVHGDRVDRHVRPRAGVGRRPLEVQAEAGQALRGAVGEDHPVAGQEPVRGRVVDQVHQRVQAGVAAVAGLRVQHRARRRQGTGAGRAPRVARRRGASAGEATASHGRTSPAPAATMIATRRPAISASTISPEPTLPDSTTEPHKTTAGPASQRLGPA